MNSNKLYYLLAIFGCLLLWSALSAAQQQASGEDPEGLPSSDQASDDQPEEGSGNGNQEGADPEVVAQILGAARVRIAEEKENPESSEEDKPKRIRSSHGRSSRRKSKKSKKRTPIGKDIAVRNMKLEGTNNKAVNVQLFWPKRGSLINTNAKGERTIVIPPMPSFYLSGLDINGLNTTGLNIELYLPEVDDSEPEPTMSPKKPPHKKDKSKRPSSKEDTSESDSDEADTSTETTTTTYAPKKYTTDTSKYPSSTTATTYTSSKTTPKTKYTTQSLTTTTYATKQPKYTTETTETSSTSTETTETSSTSTETTSTSKPLKSTTEISSSSSSEEESHSQKPKIPGPKPKPSPREGKRSKSKHRPSSHRSRVPTNIHISLRQRQNIPHISVYPSLPWGHSGHSSRFRSGSKSHHSSSSSSRWSNRPRIVYAPYPSYEPEEWAYSHSDSPSDERRGSSRSRGNQNHNHRQSDSDKYETSPSWSDSHEEGTPANEYYNSPRNDYYGLDAPVLGFLLAEPSDNWDDK